MVTDAQVRLMRRMRMDGKTQAAAAAASGMSLRTAREWDAGPVPSATKRSREWRTQPNPFAAVWPTDVEPLLRRDRKGVLEAKWVLELLRTRYPEQFHAGQARTLQRRFRDWRARHAAVQPPLRDLRRVRSRPCVLLVGLSHGGPPPIGPRRPAAPSGQSRRPPRSSGSSTRVPRTREGSDFPPSGPARHTPR